MLFLLFSSCSIEFQTCFSPTQFSLFQMGKRSKLLHCCSSQPYLLSRTEASWSYRHCYFWFSHWKCRQTQIWNPWKSDGICLSDARQWKEVVFQYKLKHFLFSFFFFGNVCSKKIYELYNVSLIVKKFRILKLNKCSDII